MGHLTGSCWAFENITSKQLCMYKTISFTGGTYANLPINDQKIINDKENARFCALWAKYLKDPEKSNEISTASSNQHF